MARILIAGCGYVGTALGQRLAREGHEVCGLRRHSDALPPGINGVAADLGAPEQLRSLHGPWDVVIYAAGAGSYDEDAYRQAYVAGLTNLLEAVHAEGPPGRVIYTSSTAVYAQENGEWVDEDSPADASHFSGRLVREGETIALAYGAPALVVRLGGIYGPGRTRLMDTVRNGAARVDPGAPRYLNLNHRDDCAGALHHLMFLENPAPVYLACDGAPADRAEVLRWIAERMGVPPPPERGHDDKVSMRQGGNKRCRNARLLASGYRFNYQDYKAGYGSLIDAARET